MKTRRERFRPSLEGRAAAVVVCALIMLALLSVAGDRLPVPGWLVQLTSLGLVIPVAVWAVRYALKPLRATLSALSDGILSFRDRDFSVRLTSTGKGELEQLVQLYNQLAELLQQERSQVKHRELLLQSALNQSPVATLLIDPRNRVVYANQEARRLLLAGEKLERRRFTEILHGCPAAMRQVLEKQDDGIFTVDAEDQNEIYQLAQRRFQVNRLPHTLILLRRLTPELARQEAEIWKKVIRIISHELNNSLAPISSLANSGMKVAKNPEQLDKLEPIYLAIRERIDHLTRFLEGYARFARLPEPKKQLVSWQEVLAGPRELYAFEIEGDLPASPAWLDPSQITQVLINLLKNAAEASTQDAQISLRVTSLSDGGTLVQVLDRGQGISVEVMRQSLLPFYSTKQEGSGVGLPLCREIVEAHGGTLRIQSRPGGGTAVSFQLPAGPLQPLSTCPFQKPI